MRAGLARRAVLASVIGVLVVSGCQYNTEIGAVNRCGEPVEVDVVSSKSSVDDGPAGEKLDPGERDYIRGVPEDKDSVYVMVRREGAERFVTRSLPVDDLSDPPKGADYDEEVVVSGTLCPG